MPKYRNSTDVDIAVGSYRFPANSDLEINTFIETIPAGLALVSVDPQHDDVLLSEKYAKTAAQDQLVAVPDNPDGTTYRIQIYVATGEFQVRFNTADAEPLRIAAGKTVNRFVTTKSIEDIRLHCVANGTVWVNILKG